MLTLVLWQGLFFFFLLLNQNECAALSGVALSEELKEVLQLIVKCRSNTAVANLNESPGLKAQAVPQYLTADTVAMET